MCTYIYTYTLILISFDKVCCTFACTCRRHLDLWSDAVFAESHWLAQLLLCEVGRSTQIYANYILNHNHHDMHHMNQMHHMHPMYHLYHMI